MLNILTNIDFHPKMFSDNSSSIDAEISSEDLMSDEEIIKVKKLREERQNWKGRLKKGRHNTLAKYFL